MTPVLIKAVPGIRLYLDIPPLSGDGSSIPNRKHGHSNVRGFLLLSPIDKTV